MDYTVPVKSCMSSAETDISSDASGAAASCVATSCVSATVFDVSLVVMGAGKAAAKAAAAAAARVLLVILVSIAVAHENLKIMIL